jgi:hypothetical protein
MGDSHYCYVDKPMIDSHGRRVQNFTRLETYGPDDSNWVRVTVDRTDPRLFRIAV